MQVYVVTAHKWGSLESHSYVCGVFSDRQQAIDASEKEMSLYQGKYDCMITTLRINEPVEMRDCISNYEWVIPGNYDRSRQKEDDYTKSLYRTF